MAILLLILFFNNTGFARSVDIAIKNDQNTLSISNPSSVVVSYDIICHKADGSGTIINNSGQTLTPNAKADIFIAIADSGKCTGNANPLYSWNDKNGKAIHACGGSVTYANAASLCGTGNSFCMPDSMYSACSTWINCTAGSVWVKSEAPTDVSNCGTWGHSYNTTSDAVILDGSLCTNYNVRKSNSVPTSEYYSPANIVAKTTTHGALCCAGGNVYSSYCRITINNTEPDARLISPSFKNGAAF